MTIPNLGTLETVNLRDAWDHEAHSFTPWLAANLSRLSAALGIPLDEAFTEVRVGPFSADIVATNPQDGSTVLIENQLEAADHTHLGQILTYLAGLQANVVVWVAAQFLEPHLSAVNWLNEHTTDEVAFFAVQVKAVRIADSPIAPLFEVVAKPNTWDRRLAHTAREASGDLSAVGQKRLAFWTHLLTRHPEQTRWLPAPNAASNQWHPVADTGLVLSLYVAAAEVGLFVRAARNVPSSRVNELLDPFRERLAEELGVPNPQTNESLWIGRSANTDDRAMWDELTDWLVHQQEAYLAALLSVLGDEPPSTPATLIE